MSNTQIYKGKEAVFDYPISAVLWGYVNNGHQEFRQENVVKKAKIRFTVYSQDEPLYKGTVRIKQDSGDSLNWSYNVTLKCRELEITQNRENGGGIIRPVSTKDREKETVLFQK